MDKVGVFIDGGYLDYVVRTELQGIRFDYMDLVSWMCQGVELGEGSFPTLWMSACGLRNMFWFVDNHHVAAACRKNLPGC